jgi:hypothetical protein
MDVNDVPAFFQTLIDTRIILSLQGSYQRTACDLVRAGLCSQGGGM